MPVLDDRGTRAPSLQAVPPCLLSDQRWQRLEIKRTINVMCWNHPKTSLSTASPEGKISSMKPVPGAKKFGDCYSKGPLTALCPQVWINEPYTSDKSSEGGMYAT